jgi:hypothetical protein
VKGAGGCEGSGGGVGEGMGSPTTAADPHQPTRRNNVAHSVTVVEDRELQAAGDGVGWGGGRERSGS